MRCRASLISIVAAAAREGQIFGRKISREAPQAVPGIVRHTPTRADGGGIADLMPFFANPTTGILTMHLVASTLQSENMMRPNIAFYGAPRGQIDHFSLEFVVFSAPQGRKIAPPTLQVVARSAFCV